MFAYLEQLYYVGEPMYVQITATIAVTMATSTSTGRQAERDASSVSLLLTVVFIGFVLVTLIWSVCKRDLTTKQT
jgi:hypothetical protein